MHAEVQTSANGCIRCGFDAAVDGHPRACPACEATAAGDFCGRCGTELEHGHGARRAMRSLFRPVAEYVEHARALIRPSHVIHEIRERHFTIVELLGFWVAAILITSLVMTVLPAHKVEEHFAPPILTEALQAVVVMGMLTLLYTPMHLMLRIGRRDVGAREFVMVMLTIIALVLPWLTLFEGVLARTGLVGDPSNWSWIVLLPPLALALGQLYRRHVAIAAAMIVGYFVLLVAVVAALALAGARMTHQSFDTFVDKVSSGGKHE